MTGPWTIYAPYGEVTTAVEYYHQKMSFANITDQMEIYLNKGTFYKTGGYLMNPETDKCMTSTGNRNNVSYSYSACCNHFDYVKIPGKFEGALGLSRYDVIQKTGFFGPLTGMRNPA
uniref:Uncharacterized protein n=1 Tax=Panagrolaimus davidi TaxID=227884 RepID=A0A914QYK1_9BILA